ncbi:16S rRNA (guanine966-N2)-methyltransferase [Jatrophihabitans sp. GAS493]|uniref:16S rRNA (guanine(966)-N(2))-methyltransferase RsmD n=1 Tax=Jatrophihabitans sp. GAS493 TaxID=1907575 RepID=UPI000BB6F2FE|nr:16S rRNA (guanine(966)-N(2))-methyltransferase RsmD [Jatrophihabitans sp. GAS493]SOD73429.1 16S rRNA (guanine966-N2)-methyltransferase [Jatrophihabitans sp. GAS493]
MTRIIAGLARGRRLSVAASGTRPTSDRAREGLFNSLQTMMDLDGVRILDLYAGSGAIGLEALSRGAAQATMVERTRAAAQVLRANVAAVGLPGAEVVEQPVELYLSSSISPGPEQQPRSGFDLVVADPPYAMPRGDLDPVLAALCRPGWLSPDAIVVVERSARGPALVWPPALEQIKAKRYGEAALWYGQQR